MTAEEKKAFVAQKMREILEVLGMDLSDPDKAKTPDRVASLYVDEMFWGYDPTHFPEDLLHDHTPTTSSEMIIVSHIPVISFCEHHLIPMLGEAHIGYLPHDKILGFSKINRIVRYFSKRPQLQERLTADIANSLSEILNSPHIAVSITATHFCVATRGTEDPSTTATTHHLQGHFLTDPSRTQFFSALPTREVLTSLI